MVLWKCVLCGSKKLSFIKNQETSGLLIKIDIKTSLIKNSSLGNLFLLILLMHCPNDGIVINKVFLIQNESNSQNIPISGR